MYIRDYPAGRSPARLMALGLALATAGLMSALAGAAPATATDTATATATPGDAASAGPETASGRWQTHEVEFPYFGFTSIYSCEGLETKLLWLLRRAGARRDATVRSWGCPNGEGRPTKFVNATLKFASLQPLDADASPAVASDAPPPLVGSWRQVDLEPHGISGLDVGDCELIEQFRDRVLPLFSTRALRNRVQCVPYQDNIGGFSLQFEAFGSWPPPKSH